MHEVQRRLTLHAAEYLLNHCFSSKKVMSDQLGIPYRALLRVCHEEGAEQEVQCVLCCIARYCLQEHIPPTELFHGFSTI